MTTLILFDGTENSHSNKTIITELVGDGARAAFCDELETIYISGSGTHGWRRFGSSVTGWDSMYIIKRQYERLSVEIEKRVGSTDSDIVVHIFGFSRGAYQATLFSELLLCVGVPENPSLCAEGIKDFCNYLASKRQNKVAVKRGFRSVRVRYLGLIDTVRAVSSFGPWPKWKTDVIVDKRIEEVRHAISIHELLCWPGIFGVNVRPRPVRLLPHSAPLPF